MIEIKDVIAVLCEYLSETIDSALTPEHFRLAKYNKLTDDAVNIFWDALEKLTYYALVNKNEPVLFNEFDNKYTRVKLRLAFLQCSHIDIFSFSETNNSNNRALLCTLAWLLTKYNILEQALHLKLINSSLGREFSKVNVGNKNKENCEDINNLYTIDTQIKKIMQESNKVNKNLKEIYELIREKVRLMTKVHTASLTTNGLPHLSVQEMALIKNIIMNENDEFTNSKEIHEFEKTAKMLELKLKWSKTMKIFYVWMETVIDEYEKKTELSNSNITEISSFVEILRKVVKKQLKSLKDKEAESSPIKEEIQDCPSKFIRNQKSVSEASDYIEKAQFLLDKIDENLNNRKEDIHIELNSLLNFIPNCIQI